LFSLGLIAFGGYTVWEQHSGTTARMTVTDCHVGGSSSTGRRHRIHTAWGRSRNNCWGTVVNQAGSPRNSMRIWGAEESDKGHDIDVHIHGRQAIADKWWAPPVVLGVGCVLVVGLVVYALRPRRLSAAGY
jgi:hypothetical protein